MAKLIHILAASVGSGLVLGASIRLGEAIGASARERTRDLKREPPNRGPLNREALNSEARTTQLANRLERLEQKIGTKPEPSPEWQSVLARVTARIDRQQAEVQALRNQISTAIQPQEAARREAAPQAGSWRERGADPVEDLRRQLDDNLDRRLADLEEKFHLSMEAANRKTVDVMVASIERRLAPRIDRLETEISDQSAAVAELRDCSLQSERSIQRLLTVMERTIGSRGQAAETSTEQTGIADPSRQEPKLAVVSGRGQDEPGGGSGPLRRPVFR